MFLEEPKIRSKLVSLVDAQIVKTKVLPFLIPDQEFFLRLLFLLFFITDATGIAAKRIVTFYK